MLEIKKPADKPIEVLIHTKKEDITAHVFLDSEFQKLLVKHIPNVDPSSKFLFQSEKGGRLSEKRARILGVSDEIKKKFQKVDKLHFKGKTEKQPK